MTILPWQNSLWDSIARQPLPPALLLAGREGIGKFAFAKALAQRIMCESSQACGKCRSCRWFESEVHPDFHLLEPQEEQESERKKVRVIKVDQIRELNEKAVIASSGTRIFMLHPAETMNANAQNALLKILEEPPAKVLIILVSHQTQRLLPTVLSRCRRMSMPEAKRETALTWLIEQKVAQPEPALAAAGGAPLRALRLSEQSEARTMFMRELSQSRTALALAQVFLKFDSVQVVHWLQQWTYDLMLQHNRRKVHYNVDCEAELAILAGQIGIRAIHALQRELLAARRVVEHSLNPTLFMEYLSFLYWRYAQHG
ncbi:MAG: DNA polymerase III subunit delta' [Burkholderiales bacterium]